MTSVYIVIAATIATIITRFLPIFLSKYFKDNVWLKYLSKVLPTASFGLLVIYSIKDTVLFESSSYVLFFCALLIIYLQLKYDKILLSIFVPTIIYVIILNFFI